MAFGREPVIRVTILGVDKFSDVFSHVLGLLNQAVSMVSSLGRILTNAISSMTSAAAGFASAFGGVGAAIGAVFGVIGSVISAVANLFLWAFDVMTKVMGETASAVLGFVNEAVQALEDLGNALASVGTRAWAMAGAIAAALYYAGSEVYEFVSAYERGFAFLRSVVEEFGGAAEETSEILADLNTRIYELGMTTVYSVDQVAWGAVALAKAGLTAEETFVALEDIIHLAAIGLMDLEDAATGAIRIMRGFGYAAEDMARIVDVLATADIKSTGAVRDLTLSMGYVAGAAASMGLSIEETAAYVVMLTDSLGSGAGGMIMAGRAGRYLRAMLYELRDPKTVEYLESLGIRIYDQNGAMLELIDILEEVRKVTKGYTEEQMADFLDKLGLEREATTAFELLLERQLGRYNELMDALAKTGVATDVYTTRIKNIGDAMLILQNAVKGAITLFSEQFTPAVMGIANALAAFIAREEFINWVKETAALIYAILMPTLKEFRDFLVSLLTPEALAGISAFLAHLASAVIPAFTEAMKGLRELLDPAKLQLFADAVVAFLSGLSVGVVQGFVQALTFFRDLVIALFPNMYDLGNLLGRFIGAGMALTATLGPLLFLFSSLTTYSGMLLPLIVPMLNAMTRAIPVLTEPLNKLVTLFTTLFLAPENVERWANALTNLLINVLEPTINILISWLESWTPERISAVFTAFTEFASTFTPAFVSLITRLVDIMVQFFQTISPYGKTFVDFFVMLFVMFGRLVLMLSWVAASFASTFKWLFRFTDEFINRWFDMIKDIQAKWMGFEATLKLGSGPFALVETEAAIISLTDRVDNLSASLGTLSRAYAFGAGAAGMAAPAAPGAPTALAPTYKRLDIFLTVSGATRYDIDFASRAGEEIARALARRGVL